MDSIFMGKNGFYWFFGTVEDNGDPLGLGRCKIRAVGWHNEDYNTLPTQALPWAVPLLPVTSAPTENSPIGPKPGTRVLGFFLDGETAQQPMFFGSLTGTTENIVRRALEAGSTMWAPNDEALLYSRYNQFEDDSPVGYNADNTNINNQVPDPRSVEIDVNEWVLPTTGFVCSAYGERSGAHKGVDICPAGYFKQTDGGASHLNNRLRGPVGNPVLAAADGEVVYIWTADKGQGGAETKYDLYGPRTGNSRSYGNAVAIKHTLSTGSFITIYAHLGTSQDPSLDQPGAGIDVTIGDTVVAGQTIGTLGRSHVWDVLTHLHFEIRVGDSLPKANNHINPGRVFPQLMNRHSYAVSWAESQSNYDTLLPFNKDNAPVIAGARASV